MSESLERAIELARAGRSAYWLGATGADGVTHWQHIVEIDGVRHASPRLTPAEKREVEREERRRFMAETGSRNRHERRRAEALRRRRR